MLKRLLLTAALLFAATAAQAGTLEQLRQKGFVACGVNPGLGGFSMPDSKDVWRGLDVDVRRADDRWLEMVRWSMMAMLEAEELGITSTNANRMRADSHDATVQCLLGKSGNFGKLMRLDNAWALHIVSHVGNHGESYERNVGLGSSLKLERGPNALWTKGGLIYAVPFR
jgi:hypothetical protein